MVKQVLIALGFVLAACTRAAPGAPGPAPTLDVAWRLGGLANPESAALSRDGGFLYVTNVNGEADAKDGNGFISRVSLDGGMLEREFATGLNGPKGIALLDGRLYVADIDAIAVIDAGSGAVQQVVAGPDAAFLNDLAITADGVVLVSDSRRGRISSLRAGAIATWLEDPLLQSINGLAPEPDRLLVTTMAGRLLSVDYGTRAITVLAEGLGDADGIAPVGDGRYFISEWPGLMHVVNPANGARETVIDSRAENRYINDFLRLGDRLYAPHWEPSELSAYRIGAGGP